MSWKPLIQHITHGCTETTITVYITHLISTRREGSITDTTLQKVHKTMQMSHSKNNKLLNEVEVGM